MHEFASLLLKEGGPWLRTVRGAIQRQCRNGESVTWGSLDELSPPLRVRDVEEIAAAAVAADRNASAARAARKRREEACAAKEWGQTGSGKYLCSECEKKLGATIAEEEGK